MKSFWILVLDPESGKNIPDLQHFFTHSYEYAFLINAFINSRKGLVWNVGEFDTIKDDGATTASWSD
jgi:hypothetical protein